MEMRAGNEENITPDPVQGVKNHVGVVRWNGHSIHDELVGRAWESLAIHLKVRGQHDLLSSRLTG